MNMKKILKKVWFSVRVGWDLIILNLQNPKILWALIVNKVRGK